MISKIPAWTLLGTLLTVGAAITLSQLSPPAALQTRSKPAGLSETGTLLLNGRPFFPIGMYHVNHTDAEYATLARHGFNAIQGHITTSVPHFIETLELARRHGLAVAVPLHAQNMVKENLDASLAKIQAAAKHPSVMSWKICDEPDSERYAGLRVEVPVAWRAIKALNPSQPVQLTLCQDASLAVWTKFCDLVEIDRYPVPTRPLTDVLDFAKLTRGKMEPWQNLIYVVQCGWTRDLKTQPDPRQARSMVYLALIGGAKGIFWYSRQEDVGWDLVTTPLWPYLRELNAETASLAAPVMLGKDVAGIRCSSKAVRYRAWQLDRQIYLLATNPGAENVQADFILPASIKPAAARLAGSSERIPIHENTVRLQLPGTSSATLILAL